MLSNAVMSNTKIQCRDQEKNATNRKKEGKLEGRDNGTVNPD